MMNTPRIMRVGPIGQTARLALAILEVFQPSVQDTFDPEQGFLLSFEFGVHLVAQGNHLVTKAFDQTALEI